MINAITRKPFTPEGEFSNLWLNTENGNIYIWNGKPVLIGVSKEGGMIKSDVFSMSFKYTPKKNEQEYEYDISYDSFPLMVLAEVSLDGYEGSDVEIYFGDKYGIVEAKDGFFLVNQVGNVELGSDIVVKCDPTKGVLNFNLIVITYE